MTSFRRGDVVLVLFPDSNLHTAKKRPALIVQADNVQTGLNQVIVAMITSNMSRANHPSRVALYLNSDNNQQTGLQLDSVIVRQLGDCPGKLYRSGARTIANYGRCRAIVSTHFWFTHFVIRDDVNR